MIHQELINKYEYKFKRINFYLSSVLSSIIAIAAVGIIIAMINESIQRDRINFMFQKTSGISQDDKNQSLIINKGISKGFVQKMDLTTYNFNSSFENASLSFLNQNNNNKDTLLDFQNANFNINIQEQQKITKIVADLQDALFNISNNTFNATSGVDITIEQNNVFTKIQSLNLDFADSILKITEDKGNQASIFLQKDLNTMEIKSNAFKINPQQFFISSDTQTTFNINLKENGKSSKAIVGNFNKGFRANKFESLIENTHEYIDNDSQNKHEITSSKKQKNTGYILEGLFGRINIVESNKNAKDSNIKMNGDNIILKLLDKQNAINAYSINKVDVKYEKQDGGRFTATCDFAEYNSNQSNQNNLTNFVRLRSNVVVNIYNKNKKSDGQNINAVCGDAKYDIDKNNVLLTNKVYIAGLTDKGSFYIDGLQYNLNEGLMTTLNNKQLEYENHNAITASSVDTNLVLKNGETLNLFVKYLQNTDIFQEYNNIRSKQHKEQDNDDFTIKTPFFANDKNTLQPKKQQQENREKENKNNNEIDSRIAKNKDTRHKIHINIDNANK